ncbi:hypothetical protein JXQ70_12220 [bacterium]|nr:hypothetical protein [bacterium]
MTAYDDKQFLDKAKLSGPNAYILKPFHERDFAITLELALSKARAEKQIEERGSWLEAILSSLDEAVIAMDRSSLIVFINPVA